MSQIPRSGSKCPVVSTTSKTVRKIPGTNQTITTTTTKTTTTSNVPSSGLRRPGSIRPPSTATRVPQQGLRPPSTGAASRMQTPQSRAPCPGPTPASRPTAQRSQQPPPRMDISGQYTMPMEYGPATLKGKREIFSSPPGLRPGMEAKLPQELKYYSNVPTAGAGRDRKLLQQYQNLQDTTSGSFNVYGGISPPQYGPQTYDESFAPLDTSSLNREIDPTANRDLFDLTPDDSPVKTVDVFQDVINQSISSPDSKVSARGSNITQVQQPFLMTPQGIREPVLQQTVLERKVKRSEDVEHVTKHLTSTDVDERTGMAQQVQLDFQQMDPNYGIPGKGNDEIITITSKISVGPTFTQSTKTVTRETTGSGLASGGADMDPKELSMLVEEETEDVENTLKMVPADLELTPRKFALKKRLQNLRLNSESMGLLEQSVIYEAPTADEAQTEASPEVIATIIHTVENGMTPQSPPTQVFNTLFKEANDNQFINMNSVAPGPLQDVLVPATEMSQQIHNEMLTDGIQKLSNEMDKIAKSADIPSDDIFTRVINEEKRQPKGQPKRVFKGIPATGAPWGGEDLEPMVNLVGAEPIDVLEMADVEELEKSGNLQEEMTNGIEYFVEADPLQYMSRVQLRGSLMPKWFPGYMVALPEYTDVVRLARSPSEVLYSAWKAVQPKYFPEESISTL